MRAQALTGMLERPDLVRSPIALAKVVELLQAMLSPQLDPRRRALGGATLRPAEMQCLDSVGQESCTVLMFRP